MPDPFCHKRYFFPQKHVSAVKCIQSKEIKYVQKSFKSYTIVNVPRFFILKTSLQRRKLKVMFHPAKIQYPLTILYVKTLGLKYIFDSFKNSRSHLN